MAQDLYESEKSVDANCLVKVNDGIIWVDAIKLI